MKTNKFTKIALAILTIALCVGAVFAMNVSAADPAAPKIISQNIKYGEDYRIMYAVDADDITGPVTLKVYNEYPTAASIPVYENTNSTTEYISKLEKNVYKFTTQAISHLNMTDVFYVQAETAVNGKSEIRRYSVAEYLYQRLSDSTITEAQKALYESTIAYGNNLQIVVNEESNPNNLIANLRYVFVSGGTVDGKYQAGLYAVGSTVKPQADGVSGWNAVLYGAAGTQIDSIATGDIVSYKIPETAGLVGVKFTTGNVLTYHDGTIDFNDITSVPSYITTTDSVTPEVENGVLKFTTTLNNKGLTFNLADMPCKETVASAADATAIEISFDLKVTQIGESKKQFIRFNTRDTDNKLYHRAEYDFVWGSSTNPIRISCIDNSAESREFDLDSAGWVNIRIVYYKGDTSTNENYGYMHIYVNGDTENPLLIKTHYASGKAYSGDLNIPVFNLWGAGTDGQGTVYVDNFFYGYTTEAIPE